MGHAINHQHTAPATKPLTIIYGPRHTRSQQTSYQLPRASSGRNNVGDFIAEAVLRRTALPFDPFASAHLGSQHRERMETKPTMFVCTRHKCRFQKCQTSDRFERGPGGPGSCSTEGKGRGGTQKEETGRFGVLCGFALLGDLRERARRGAQHLSARHSPKRVLLSLVGPSGSRCTSGPFKSKDGASRQFF